MENFPQQSQKLPGIQSDMTPPPEVIKANYQGSEKLRGKIALITGGDSGIGQSVAVHFAREGAHVAIIYLEEDSDAETTKKLVEAEGARCLLIRGDLTNPQFCADAVREIKEHYGTINIIVNNAATQFIKDTLYEVTDEQVQRTFQTNIIPYFSIVRAALKYLDEGDAIVNTSSVTAYRGSDHLIDYASTKAAVVGFTRSLSANLAKKGIRVNGVAPGPIWTPLIVASFKEVANFGKDTPMGRAGQPSEVAPAYVYLASDDSSFVTGQFIHVNGGEIIGS